MKPFPWRPRMAATSHESGFRLTLIVIRDGMALCSYDCGIPGVEHIRSGWYRLEMLKPVEDDFATLGAFLGAVEEVWRPIGVITVVAPVATTHGEPWRVRVVNYLGDHHSVFEASTRFDALYFAWNARS